MLSSRWIQRRQHHYNSVFTSWTSSSPNTLRSYYHWTAQQPDEPSYLVRFLHSISTSKKKRRLLALIFMLLVTIGASYLTIRISLDLVWHRTRENSVSYQTTTTNQECSCWSINSAPRCCQRKVLRAHKMGVVLIQQLFGDIDSDIINPKHVEPFAETANTGKERIAMDYRHVVVTRPLYDSIISGYLYHLAGNECWLDQYGKPRQNGNKTFAWDTPNLKLQPLQPPAHNRSLCSYLNEESEQDGMRAYVDFSLNNLYRGLLPHKQLVEQVEGGLAEKKTLFVCFRDLENPATRQSEYEKVWKWLYPNPNAVERTRIRDLGLEADREKIKGGSETLDTGSGGHGTSRDVELRKRLRALIEKYDLEYFKGIGAETTRLFGCE